MKHSVENKSRATLSEWMSVHLDIPADLGPDALRLDLRGRNTLTVHGCRRIVDFTPCSIRLALAGCELLVEGERLTCTSYLAGAVGIEGCICRMEFLNTEETR